MSVSQPSRREAIAVGAALAGGACLLADDKPALKGNINHSVVFWCFNVAGEKWDLDKTCAVTKSLGGKSVELVGASDLATIKKHGLTCAIVGNGTPKEPFKYGFNNTKFHGELKERTSKAIEAAADAGVPSVIGFVGYKWLDPNDPKSGEITRDDAFKNCVSSLKELATIAEKKGVTVCIEHLNTRDDSHPMKGHPGYQGDDLDFVADILRKVGSPRIKLLFDVYHVQIMHGDVIRRIEQTKDVIGHIHTAGNPGRAELDDMQEINYPAIMKKLTAIKYAGYVGHEFIPTRDPLAGLKQAITTCDV